MVIAILVAFVPLVACGPTPGSHTLAQPPIPVADGQPAYQIGLFMSTSDPLPDIHGDDPGALLTYNLAAGSSFKARLSIENGSAEATTYAVTGLLDFRQSGFSLDGAGAGARRVTVAPGAAVALPVVTDALSFGAHDFTMLVFHRPDDHGLSDFERVQIDGWVSAPQFALLVTDPAAEPTLPPRLKGVETREPNDGAIALLRDPKDETPWRRQDVAPGENVKSWVTLGNPTDKEFTGVLVLFIDFQVVPFAIGGAPQGATLVIPPRTRVRVPVNITAPASSGVHEVIAVVLGVPFGTPPADRFIGSSQRLALAVR
jgi:hypothetical protein